MRYILFAFPLFFCACSNIDDPLPPLPAEIVGVEVTPDPVGPLDTATFRVLTSRRLQQSNWNLSDGRAELRTGDTITWKAPEQPGTYRQVVTLRELGVMLDSEEFDVEVRND